MKYTDYEDWDSIYLFTSTRYPVNFLNSNIRSGTNVKTYLSCSIHFRPINFWSSAYATNFRVDSVPFLNYLRIYSKASKILSRSTNIYETTGYVYVDFIAIIPSFLSKTGFLYSLCLILNFGYTVSDTVQSNLKTLLDMKDVNITRSFDDTDKIVQYSRYCLLFGTTVTFHDYNLNLFLSFVK